ncbi:hypothetical protein GQE99_17480 [Maritimibacter sp. DP07]|uniref:Cysteine rich repeat-containing protein n=1 Tax=Maritimibacter harenae TaxID=2606218 RepID=A0A845M5I7_9RHOB|nr:hypothetical protein [Maritimibacter harenae]MZR14816.1 hypothetical protein [Maritimibacter harenae]
MTIITKTALAAFALFTTSTTGIATAGNAGASLPACVDHVVAACNENSNHPEACADAGISACEELHGTGESAANLPSIRIFELANGRYRVVLEGKPRPARFEYEAPGRGPTPTPTGRPAR